MTTAGRAGGAGSEVQPGVFKRWAAHASGRELKAVARAMEKATTKDSLRALGRLTRRVDGRLRIVGDPPLIVPIEDLATDMKAEEIETYFRSLTDAYSRSSRASAARSSSATATGTWPTRW